MPPVSFLRAPTLYYTGAIGRGACRHKPPRHALDANYADMFYRSVRLYLHGIIATAFPGRDHAATSLSIEDDDIDFD